MKKFQFLSTDFYQVAMGFAYVVEGLNTQFTGFEGFVRHVKKVTNPNENFYIFSGEQEVHDFMATIKEELKDPELVETIVELVSPKLNDSNRVELIKRFRDNWKSVDTDFFYTVVPEGSIVFPFVPVFQYNGDKMIGQMIETLVTNIYNGRTGLSTLNYMNHMDTDSIHEGDLKFLVGIMNDEPKAMNIYKSMLNLTASDFRASTDKTLLEAAFRRAPSLTTAKLASEMALKNGWDGTSNVALLLDGKIKASDVGGTMAHSWIMCFEDESDAFISWDRIFPGTTFIIDTYDTRLAAKKIKTLIDNGDITTPNDVRIDSDPLHDLAVDVDEILDGTVDIYLSGDISIKKLQRFYEDETPYHKTMAGTKYVYDNDVVARLNCGFVYKLVQYDNVNGDIIKPEKKATGKSNYAGLKTCIYDQASNTLTVSYTKENDDMGFWNLSTMDEDTTVEFI